MNPPPETPDEKSAPGAGAGERQPRGLLLYDLMVVYRAALSADVCRDMVERFESDARRHASATMDGVNVPGRSGTQLEMASLPEWADLKTLVTEISTERLHDYARRFQAIEMILKTESIVFSAPIIERVNPGQGYNWHIDSGPSRTERRFLSVLAYLNDVDGGGTTDFPMQGASFRPREGTMLLFPPFWMYPHRGAPPRSTKYVLTAYFIIDSAA